MSIERRIPTVTGIVAATAADVARTRRRTVNNVDARPTRPEVGQPKRTVSSLCATLPDEVVKTGAGWFYVEDWVDEHRAGPSIVDVNGGTLNGIELNAAGLWHIDLTIEGRAVPLSHSAYGYVQLWDDAGTNTGNIIAVGAQAFSGWIALNGSTDIWVERPGFVVAAYLYRSNGITYGDGASPRVARFAVHRVGDSAPSIRL